MTKSERGSTDHKSTVAFDSDAQLLAELGERLIARPEIALAEILKNAYDADATEAYVWVEGDSRPALTVKDDGHGMTEGEFLQYWMMVGTVSKLRRATSPRFRRSITGSKGVGRFAARRLGNHLTLRSTAKDEKGEYRRLVAVFDWRSFNAGTPLNRVQIEYEVQVGFSAEDVGTTLEIRGLRSDVTEDELPTVTREVLDIVNPPLVRPVSKAEATHKEDPGFSLYFGRPGDVHQPATAAGQEIADRWVAKVDFGVKGKKVSYHLEYREPGEDDPCRQEEWSVGLPGERNLIGEVNGEIRFLPKRPGVFEGMSTVDGRTPVRFLSEKGGVRVFDRGFRVPPYGGPDDDWLQLSAMVAQRSRSWGSSISETLFPAERRVKEESLDPMIHRPANRQLLGAVLVESHRPPTSGGGEEDGEPFLQPAMDRQGFVDNAGFRQLVEVTTAAANFIAVVDTEELDRIQREEAKARVRETRRSISKAISRIKADSAIPARARASIVRSLEEIAAQVTESEVAQRDAIQSVESMSLLGILAAFMTHETTTMLRAVNDALSALNRVPGGKDATEIAESRQALLEARRRMQMYVDYSRTFMLQAPNPSPEPFRVLPQIERVVDLFSDLTTRAGIEVSYGVGARVMSPQVTPGVYAGTVLNLFTNAVKAVSRLSDPKAPRKIRFDVDDSRDGQILSVSDTGIGIQPEIRGLIFEPFVTTTREDEGPLSGGMGLGLYIVKRVLGTVNGSIRLVDPKDGFTTTFEVTFPPRS